MAIGLIGWGRFFDPHIGKITVPAPPDGQGKPWLWDFLRTEAPRLSPFFDCVQLPPASLTQSGTAATGDGYGITWRRMLDGTRYGNTESLMACVAGLRAHGIRVYGDVVLHQFASWTRHYPNGAKGGQTEGWFRGHQRPKIVDGKFAGWNDPIPPYCPEDDVPVPADDFAFGMEVSYQHCHPPGVTEADARDYLKWFSNRAAIYDFRYDDTKGQYARSVARIMNSLSNCSFYSEYFDGNPANLNWWATSAPMNGRSAVEDFTLHWRLQAACNGFDARQFDQNGAGYWQQRPDLSVLFVDNPDTDTSPGQQIIFNKGIAYALMLNLPCRLALVYGKDYFPSSVWPGAYGLKPIVDNIAWFARTFALGNWERRWVDKDVYAFTRDGNGGAIGWSGGCLVAANFNTLNSRTIRVQTMWAPGTWIHDYSGHCADATVGADGYVSITLPSNAFSAGVSFGLFAPGGVNHPVPNPPIPTTQVYEGAHGEDVSALNEGPFTLPQRIRCAAGSTVKAVLTIDRTRLNESSSAEISIQEPDGTLLASASTGSGSHVSVSGKIREAGWHALGLIGHGIPAGGASFSLSVTYTGLA